MSWSLLLLCAAGASIVALMVSGAIGLLLPSIERSLREHSPEAASRALLALTLIPALLTTAILGAALAPSFGWIADHCNVATDPHSHPHICAHHESAWPPAPLLILAAYLTLRVGAVGAQFLYRGAQALRVKRALLEQARVERSGELFVLPLSEPQAFVLGALRPTLFITRGLLESGHAHHVDTVVAHERAHMARADGLRLLLAKLACTFHLPHVGRRLEQELHRAHEMAADEAAARAVGSRSLVAETLVQLTRAQRALPLGALAFGSTAIELRVRSLLDTSNKTSAPTVLQLAAVTALGLLVIASLADPVHHGLELLLGALSV